MRVPTEGYARLTAPVRDVAADVDAGLAFVLEGGYGLDTLSHSVRTVHRVFDGYEPAPVDGEVDADAETVIEDLAAQGFGS
jgi:acetoin utilization deacetylase AcuC-like enzyme